MTRIKRGIVKRAPSTGPVIHVATIFERVAGSVLFPVKRFHPIIAPTIAWVVETGRENFVIMYTVMAEVRARVKEPPIALTAPSLPRVWVCACSLYNCPEDHGN